MADEIDNEPKLWSLDEIDELLSDSESTLGRADDRPQAQKDGDGIDPRPVHNDEIRHEIKKTGVIHSDASAKTRVFGALESDKYRERFLNRPVQNLEKTAEHKVISAQEKPYERGGFVKRESSFRGTGELDPVPSLVADDILLEEERAAEEAAEDEPRTMGLRALAVTNGNAHETELPEEDDAQIRLEGFDSSDRPEKIDEEEAEEELNKKRRKVAEDFVISREKKDTASQETAAVSSLDEEYRTPNDKVRVASLLKKKQSRAFFGAAVSFVVLIALTVLSAFSSSIASQKFLTAQLVLLVLAIIAGRSVVWDGLCSFARFHLNRNSGCVLALLVVCLQNIFFLAARASLPEEYSTFGAAAVFPLLLNLCGYVSEYKRTRMNFRYVTSREMYSVSPIEKKEAAFEVGRGLLIDDPIVISSHKTLFPKRFLESSRANCPADELNRRTVPICTAVSAVIAVLTGLHTKNIFGAISAFSAALCVSAPAFIYLADSGAILSAVRALRAKGAVLSGWQAHTVMASANAVAVDSSELFDREGGNIHGIKTYSSIKVDDAILVASALLVESGGPLGDLFKRVILDKTSLLPPVDTLAYEDKLGLSAWIGSRRVLVGSRDLLVNHNVDVPPQSEIDKFLHDGRYPLFLAIESRLAAMFIISYDVDEENARLLRRIERSGLSLLVRTDDANLTEEMLSKGLGLPQSGVKVLSAVSGEILKGCRREVGSAADSYLMHDGKGHSFLAAVAAALSLGDIKRISTIFQVGAIGISLAFVAVLAFVSGLTNSSCVQLVLSQCFFCAAGLIAVSMKK